MRFWITITLLAVSFTVVMTSNRIEELRQRRPVDWGLSQLFLCQASVARIFPKMVTGTGMVRLEFNRRNARQSIGNIHKKLTETDRKFVRAVNAYVISLLIKYNGIVHWYLNQWTLTIAENDMWYRKAMDAIEFRDKSDGFALLSYLHDNGLNVKPAFDNLLFYTVPWPKFSWNPNSERRRIEYRIQTLIRFGVGSDAGRKPARDFTIASSKIEKELSALETRIHQLSKLFSGEFLQWLQVYTPDDKFKRHRDRINVNYPVMCKIWVNIW